MVNGRESGTLRVRSFLSIGYGRAPLRAFTRYLIQQPEAVQDYAGIPRAGGWRVKI